MESHRPVDYHLIYELVFPFHLYNTCSCHSLAREADYLHSVLSVKRTIKNVRQVKLLGNNKFCYIFLKLNVNGESKTLRVENFLLHGPQVSYLSDA